MRAVSLKVAVLKDPREEKEFVMIFQISQYGDL